jgi:antitoxin HigA-1
MLIYIANLRSKYQYSKNIKILKIFINKIVCICTMNTILNQIKGIHPGKFIDRELKKRGYNQRRYAIFLCEHPQTLNAIIKGRRSMNTELSVKIENTLDLEQGFLMTLQVFYDIKLLNLDVNYKPDFSKLREGIFWDTSFDKIDWKLMKRAVITRVFAYGNEIEQKEIIRFYGEDEVARINTLYPEKLTR